MTGFEGVDGWNFVGRRPLGTLSSGTFARPAHVASLLRTSQTAFDHVMM
jgi:hypothetical protein